MNDTFQGEVSIQTESDIVIARRAVREAAVERGFNATEVTRIVTASSEMARNIFKYAKGGEMRWRGVEKNGCPGIELQFIDHGPGIENLELAMEEGYSTGDGLGMGLPGAKRLVDELQIQSVVGKGTTVILRKWRKS
jgi:serine/threonine-protein kinase RsbT